MIEGGPLSAETSLSALGPGGLSSALWLKLRRQQDLLSQRPTADAVDFQPWEPEPLMSGQDAFQGGAVGRGSVRREDELDREVEERPQPRDDLRMRNVAFQPLVQPEAAAEVHQRVPEDEGPPGLDPELEAVVLPPDERLDADRKPVARGEPGDLGIAAAQPCEIRAAITGLLGGDTDLVDEVLRAGGWRREDLGAEALDQALRVPPVPGPGGHDGRFA